MLLDARLIDLADRAAAWLQRRGACLATIKMLISISFAAALFAAALNPIMGFICGMILGGSYRSWNRERGYADNARLVLSLNTTALWSREHLFYARTGGWIFVAVGLGIDLAARNPLLLSALSAVLLLTSLYADCCFFLGPGEHGRQRWFLRVGRAAMQEN